jgi:hypothetical protein
MIPMNIRQMLIDYELDQMSRYLDLVQESLQRNYDQLEARYTEIGGAWNDDYEDSFVEATQEFPQLLLLSFIVIWYSFAEQKLLELCEELKLRISFGAKENENFDKGIRRARKFLLRGRNYEIDVDHWRELIEINRLRNYIVHDGKRITNSHVKPDRQFVPYEIDGGTVVFLIIDEALFSYLQKHGIATTGGPFVEILPSVEYCQSLVEFGRKLFQKLNADLRPIHQAAMRPS